MSESEDEPTPREIAAAWDAWWGRHGGRIGPGPAFVEALRAAFRERRRAMIDAALKEG